jgi:hypothetical protein
MLRVGLDGLLLAVNEAALNLVAAEQLAQVLGSKLTKLITPRQHEEWEEFVGRIKGGASASIECDLTDLAGNRRTLLFQAVPLLDHPDGVPSMILSARDISAPRRLEMALREREVSRELEDLQKQLEQGQAERQQLASTINQRESGQQELIAKHEAEQAALRQTLAEQHELALLLKEQEGKQQIDTLRADLEQALEEGRRLAAAAKSRDEEHRRVLAEHATERAQLQQALAEEHQLAIMLKEREGRQLLDGVRADLQQADAARRQLAASLEEREAAHQRAVAEHAAEREQLRQVLEEERALLLRERETSQSVESLQAELERVASERRQLAASLDEREASHQRVIAGHAAEHEQLQRKLDEREASHQLAVAGHAAEREQLQRKLDEREASHQLAVAGHAAEREQLQRKLEELSGLLAQEQESRKSLDGLRGELDEALKLAEGRRTEIEEARRLAEQRRAELEEMRSLGEDVRKRLEDAISHRHRLEAAIAEREASHERAVAENLAERARLQAVLTEEHERVLALKEQESRRLSENLKGELERAQEDRQRLVGLLDQREDDHRRLVDEHATARSEAERALLTAMQKQVELEKALADIRVELRGVDENARNLEWLAAGGRAAREIGLELQTIVEAIDARTQHLLGQSSLDSDYRHVVEALRGDAISAASLVRQIGEAGSQSPVGATDAPAAVTPPDASDGQLW